MREEIKKGLSESAELKRRLLGEDFVEGIEKIISSAVETFSGGGKILVCGNGGSAAQAQHFASELVWKLEKERRPFECVSLAADPSVLTAISNDRDFGEVFSRQVEAAGKKGDLLLAISTSGESKNILRALEKAKEKGLKTAALLGGSGGNAKGIAETSLVVPSPQTQRVQEAHETILHIICSAIEKAEK